MIALAATGQSADKAEHSKVMHPLASLGLISFMIC
jgi:hypothetical protein